MNQDHSALASRSTANADATAFSQPGDSGEQRSVEQLQVDAHTIRAREAERAALRADIEAFLASGGKVTNVAPRLRKDTPRKPQNNYGKGSL